MLKVWRQLADHESKPVWSVGFVKRQEWDFFSRLLFLKIHAAVKRRSRYNYTANLLRLIIGREYFKSQSNNKEI